MRDQWKEDPTWGISSQSSPSPPKAGMSSPEAQVLSAHCFQIRLDANRAISR